MTLQFFSPSMVARLNLPLTVMMASASAATDRISSVVNALCCVDLTAEAVDDVLLHVRDGHNVIDKNDLELAHACTSASISLNTFSP